MKHSALPNHPFMRHPHTGHPLRAVGILPSGRVVWPILGASPDDGAGDDGGGDGADDAGGAGGAGDSSGNADKGFPANTPVVEMNAAQQAAYWRHQAKKHESRNGELLQLTGGKYGEALKADLDELATLRESQKSEADKAIEAAKNEGRTEAVQTAGASAARVALEFALGHDPETNDQSALIDSLDMSKLVNTDGSVAADKVRALAATLAPSDKGSGAPPANYGAGRRGSQAAKAGQAGASEAERRFGKTAGA